MSGMTRDELLALPAVVDVPTAGRAYGLGERLSYELAQRGDFPVPVLKLGRLLKVRTCHLVADLTPDMDAAVPDRTADATTTAESVKGTRDASERPTLRAVQH